MPELPKDKIRIHIYRFNPKTDRLPTYGTYRLELSNITVLQALFHIYEHIDPTLAFRHYHCMGDNLCGSCAMLIDGKARLACKTKVKEGMQIEPLPNRVCIRDLSC